MSADLVLHHVLLALAALSLVAAALRLASLAAPDGLERAIATAVLAVAAAVAQALALGLVGLGASPVALPAAALATWALAAWRLPAPQLGGGAELRARRDALGPWPRVAVAALGGAIGATALWQLRHPSVGFDSSIYHFAEVAGWIAGGHPGSVLRLGLDLPYGNYPVTDEVALTWAAGIARSWVPLSLWAWVMWLLFGAASFTTLRNVGAPRWAAGLGTVALISNPLVVRQLNEPQTDVPALAWLACTAALCSAAPRRPALLAPAIVAGGLTIGTKTTPIALVAVALAAAAWSARAHLRPLAAWLGAATLAAVVVGGVWYLRNLLDHGHPFWPFASAPWGDPQPEFLKLVDARLLDHPVATLRGRLDGYGDGLAGGIVLLAGGVLALARAVAGRDLPRSLRRPLLGAGALALAAGLAFAAAPGTGAQSDRELWFGPMSTLRYVLPAVGAATLAVALAARAGGVTRVVAGLTLGLAIAWNLVKVLDLGAPYLPRASTMLLGAVAGVAALGLATAAVRALAARSRRLRPLPAGALAGLAALAAGVALAPAGDGYVERHARVSGSSALGSDLAGWFAARPGWGEDGRRFAFSSRAVIATLAGDRFEHRLELIPADAPCQQVRAVGRGATIVATAPVFLYKFIGVVDLRNARCLRGRRPDHVQGGFSVYAPRP